MEKPKSKGGMSLILGALLIATGVIFLLNNFDIITLDWDFLMGPLFGLGGLIFLLVFIVNTDDWWALLPGMALISLGLIIFMGQSDFENGWVGALFLGMLSLSYLLVYFFHPVHWWAIIPSGALFTLAVVSLLPASGGLSGGIFFLGLALTFWLVYILPKPVGKLVWALFPAGILFVLGILFLLGSTSLIAYFWPAALLAVGGGILAYALRK
ncbi:hypothetical protein JR338_07975 [Chloroflexota bacterium]|nr:hypothetical protein JR338_07975 [Chloroflexota bacterium]